MPSRLTTYPRLHFFTALLALCLWSIAPRTAHALPEFSHRYGVSCETCHTVAPALNEFGQAFQANFFAWPGGKPKPKSLLDELPFSAMATGSRVQSASGAFPTTTAARQLEIFASDSFTLSKNRVGGYFVDYIAAIKDARSGDLENAFVSVPFAGTHGQFAITAGQFTPLLYQYDPINSLTQTLPLGLSEDADAFSFTDATPGVRVDFFDNRGADTADGDYVSVGVPFEGHLALNQDAHLGGGSRGIFAHAFRRMAGTSVGVFGFDHDGNGRAGLLATRTLTPRLSLLAAGSLAHDDLGSHRTLSAQAEWTPIPGNLALTGRFDATNSDSLGHSDVYPVAAITYYPGGQRFVRVTAETDQPKGARVNSIYLFLQL